MPIPQDILIPTDFGVCSETALAQGFSLAAALDARVHLVHAFTMEDLRFAGSLTPDVIRAAERDAHRKLGELALRLRSGSRLGELVVRVGDPAEVILQVADEVAASLIVMGTHGRNGLVRMLLGSVTERVIREAACPVLALRQTAQAA